MTAELCIALNKDIRVIKIAWLDAVLEYKKWQEFTRWHISSEELRKRYWGHPETATMPNFLSQHTFLVIGFKNYETEMVIQSAGGKTIKGELCQYSPKSVKVVVDSLKYCDI